MKKIKHFIDTQDLTIIELFEIFELMRMLKEACYVGAVPQMLKNRTLAMIFEEPSTRTRVSFEAAMTLLGGHAQYLKPGEIHLGARETLYDTTKVLSHMVDGIMCRALKHKTITDLAEASDVPVFNALTDYNHPTQAICDVFTMLEHIPSLKNKEFKDMDFSKINVVFVGDRTNVCSSTMHITTQLGMNFTHIAPKQYQSPQEWINIADENIKQARSGSITITDDVNLIANADIVYTDLWWWVDQEIEADERVKLFKPTYQVTNNMLDKAKPTVKFMHCLPASRNVEVMDDVMDSQRSIVFEQAENRLTAQMALLVYFIVPSLKKPSQSLIDYHHAKIESFLESKKQLWDNYSYTYVWEKGKNK